jgi:hypothetical protein
MRGQVLSLVMPVLLSPNGSPRPIRRMPNGSVIFRSRAATSTTCGGSRPVRLGACTHKQALATHEKQCPLCLNNGHGVGRRHVRYGPLPDSCTAAKLTLDFDYLIGIGDGGLLGQSRFPKTLDQQLQICHPAPSDRRRYCIGGIELESACRHLTGLGIAPEMR